MKTKLWFQLAEWLEELLELEPAKRAAQLATLARQDPKLARLLEASLSADRAHIPLLDRPLQLEWSDEDALRREEDELQAGTVIGPWKLVRELGQGGMGRVWLAVRDDDQYRVEVALKLIDFARRGELVSAQIRLERQILADLDHPQIARLVDGGVRADGTPWYAMEYVEGLSLDQYCRERKPSLNERLQLIAAIARIVHHAHTRLVVHRDLKPNNILIDEQGIPHLLDFGIAKLVDKRGTQKPGMLTLLAASTPAYAAPEQLRGESVGTQSDIYSLGVIAYEIICGERPAQADSVATHSGSCRGPLVSEAITGDRRLRARVRGDIDSIISQAMARDVESRYVSAAMLADDIDRHLTGMPVLARRAGTVYRARKFLHRHWLGVGVSGALAVVLSLALVVSAIQTRRAETALARANAVQTFLLEIFDASQPGPSDIGIVPQRDLVERAAQRLEPLLSDQPQKRLDLSLALARVFRKLGFASRSEELLGQALESFGDSSIETPDSTIVAALYELGRANYYTGNFSAGLDHLSRADRLARAHPGVYDGPHRAAILFELGATQSVLRETDRAMDTLARAEQMAMASPETAGLLPRIQVLQAITLGRANRLDRALEIGSQALDSARRILGVKHERTASALSTVGGMNRRAGRLEVAERMLREARQIEIQAYGQAQSATVNNLANILLDRGLLDEAGRLYREALRLAQARLGADSPGAASYKRNLALYQATAGDADAAVENLAAAYASYASAFPIDTGNNLNMRSELSWAMLQAGEVDRAQALLPEIFSRAGSMKGIARAALCRAHMVAAQAAYREGRLQLAQEHVAAALAEVDAYPIENADTVRLYLLARDVYAAAGRLELAEAYRTRALDRAGSRLGRHHPLVAVAVTRSSPMRLPTDRLGLSALPRQPEEH